MTRPADNPPPAESLEDRWLREAQTARNVKALEAEQAGRLQDAIGLYERNAAEGFEGDWPYGRLVAIYEKLGASSEAERVLLRAIEVLGSSQSRTPQARRAMIAAFRKRLGLVRRARRAREKAGRLNRPAS